MSPSVSSPDPVWILYQDRNSSHKIRIVELKQRSPLWCPVFPTRGWRRGEDILGIFGVTVTGLLPLTSETFSLKTLETFPGSGNRTKVQTSLESVNGKTPTLPQIVGLILYPWPSLTNPSLWSRWRVMKVPESVQ